LFVRPIDLLRHYLAAFPLEAARITPFGATPTFHRGLLTRCFLHNEHILLAQALLSPPSAMRAPPTASNTRVCTLVGERVFGIALGPP
jgi:hypothetical protein